VSYAHAEPRPMEISMSARQASGVSARAGFSAMKILIVDDDRDVADSLAALVRIVLDYDVCVRYSGESAISTAGEYRPDVVILDVNMPGLDGLQTARILKMDRRLEGKTFIAHTAEDSVFVRKVASRIGFHQVVAKGNMNGVSELIDLLSDVEPSTRNGEHPR
jgi:CheY-like chemotaxis protein